MKKILLFFIFMLLVIPLGTAKINNAPIISSLFLTNYTVNITNEFYNVTENKNITNNNTFNITNNITYNITNNITNNFTNNITTVLIVI